MATRLVVAIIRDCELGGMAIGEGEETDVDGECQEEEEYHETREVGALPVDDWT